MKILEVIYRFPPAIGGSPKVCFELSNEFYEKGYDVTVVTSTSLTNDDTRGFNTSNLFKFKSSNHNSYSIKINNGKNNFEVYYFKPFFQFWPYSINLQMKKFLKKHKDEYDVIHVHGYQSYEAKIVSKIFKTYTLTAHDVIAHYGGWLAFMKGVFDKVIGKQILRNAKHLIALTPENIKEYNDILNCNDKIELIPDGINHFMKKPKSKMLLKQYNNPDFVILFVGRLVEYKGVQHIINALPSIIKKYSNIKFIIVGEDQGHKEILIKQAKQLNVEKYCCFTGKVNNLEEYYNLADVFVLPSHAEGFGLTAVEAMSVGTPTILANKGGLKYILKQDGGYPINMNSNISKQISNYIQKIYKDKHINTTTLIKKTKQFDWDKIAEKHLEVFKK